MKEKMLGFWESVKALWGNMSRKARIALLCSLVGVLIIVLVLAFMFNNQKKEYLLLYNDLSSSEYSKVLTILTDEGIDYQLAASGSILVWDKDIDRARMQVATAGVTGYTFDEEYGPSLTSTESDKNYLKKIADQKRLQTIIETHEEIKQAAVTITPSQNSSFALQADRTPPSANITIIKRQGRELTAEQVRGIINVVKHAVAGLEEENISISDENGDLKRLLDANSTANDSKLRLTEEINASARKQILSVLQPVFGVDGVSVEVSSTLDIDSHITESQTYDPFDRENPQNNPLSSGEHSREMVGDRQTIAEGVPGANDNVGTPEYGEEVDALGDNTAYSVYDVYNYLVSSTKEQIVKEGFTITGMTASVVVDTDALGDGERDQIIALAANAAGIPRENVTVASFEFLRTEPEEIEIFDGWTLRQTIMLAAGILLFLIILITVVIILISRRRKQEEEEAAEALEDVEYDENGMPLLELMEEDEEGFEPITIVETTEQKLKAQIKDLADSDPEIVAQLLKTWLSSAT